jgi:hypothetical protein
MCQVGAFKSGFRKAEGVGIPRGTTVYSGGKKGEIPVLVVDISTHLTTNYGESMIPDPDLIAVLSVVVEDKLWKFIGSVNIETWQMLALMGAGAGVLGGVQIMIGLFS